MGRRVAIQFSLWQHHNPLRFLVRMFRPFGDYVRPMRPCILPCTTPMSPWNWICWCFLISPCAFPLLGLCVCYPFSWNDPLSITLCQKSWDLVGLRVIYLISFSSLKFHPPPPFMLWVCTNLSLGKIIFILEYLPIFSGHIHIHLPPWCLPWYFQSKMDTQPEFSLPPLCSSHSF